MKALYIVATLSLPTLPCPINARSNPLAMRGDDCACMPVNSLLA